MTFKSYSGVRLNLPQSATSAEGSVKFRLKYKLQVLFRITREERSTVHGSLKMVVAYVHPWQPKQRHFLLGDRKKTAIFVAS